MTCLEPLQSRGPANLESAGVQGKLSHAVAFIRSNTRVVRVPGLPLRMHQADELTPIWAATEKDLAASNIAPPFWAFPWAGGQALARHLLDHPEIVRDKRVLD